MVRDPLQTLVHLIATEANPHQLLLQVVAELAVLDEVRRLSRTLLHAEDLVDMRIKECCRVSKIPLEFFWERLQLLARILNLIPYDQNYYEILGLDPRASPQEIKQAYRRLCFAVHPDTNPHDPQAAEHFRNLRHAYEVLSHDLLRSRYDHNLKAHWWDEKENWRVGVAGLFRRGPSFRTWPLLLLILLIIGAIFLIDYSGWQVGHYQGGMGRRAGKVESASSNEPAAIPARPSGDTQPRITFSETPATEFKRSAPVAGTPEKTWPNSLAGLENQPDSREERAEKLGETLVSDQPNPPSRAAVIGLAAPQTHPAPTPPSALEDRKRDGSRAADDAHPQQAAADKPPRKIPPRALGSKVGSTPAPPNPALSGHNIRQEFSDREIRMFISRYTRTYESRDVNAFLRLFETNAIENGRPIQELVPLYQANFKRAEKLRYRIDMERWEVREEEVMMDGSFSLAVQFEQEALVESTGSIQLTLVWHAGDFGVKRLNYSFKKSRKIAE